ncbi:class I SAM-dependent methyltransferase [Candidatus Poribacteria bacterium]|nr:class I SAM-dependent methyltransferase [Candidatus Poribacteria bacterium]
MNLTKEQREMLKVDRFPLSSKYDQQWVLENRMGPNPMWLAEWLSEAMDFKPGLRVLDLGCGTAITSIFLAKEFGVQVWATDSSTWTKIADENWPRIREASAADTVVPIRADAHALPYAEEFFDAMVSIDAYHYFGTSDTYLLAFHKYVKPGGQIGIVVPGLMQEVDREPPEHLKEWWGAEGYSFHTASWWRWHWEKTKRVNVEVADTLEDGWRYWSLFEEISWATGIAVMSEDEQHVVGVDQGRYLGFVRVVARRR